MKKLLLLCFVCTLFSCSSDDDGGGGITASQLVGTWSLTAGTRGTETFDPNTDCPESYIFTETELTDKYFTDSGCSSEGEKSDKYSYSIDGYVITLVNLTTSESNTVMTVTDISNIKLVLEFNNGHTSTYTKVP